MSLNLLFALLLLSPQGLARDLLPSDVVEALEYKVIIDGPGGGLYQKVQYSDHRGMHIHYFSPSSDPLLAMYVCSRYCAGDESMDFATIEIVVEGSLKKRQRKRSIFEGFRQRCYELEELSNFDGKTCMVNIGFTPESKKFLESF